MANQLGFEPRLHGFGGRYHADLNIDSLETVGVLPLHYPLDYNSPVIGNRGVLFFRVAISVIWQEV